MTPLTNLLTRAAKFFRGTIEIEHNEEVLAEFDALYGALIAVAVAADSDHGCVILDRGRGECAVCDALAALRKVCGK